ncbi:MAG TPA: hypothetical protein VKQ29_06590 [Aliidongia sp.]|nr:hypothetical protein [Aliidongia sp.]
MDGHDIVGGIVAVKAAVDTLRSLAGLLPGRRRSAALIPVYRLVSMNATATRPATNADAGDGSPADRSRGLSIFRCGGK